MDVPPDPARKERLARMEAVVRRMPRRTREIFLAHRVHDMPYEEIARRTGLTVRQIERHIARAILAIDRSLNGRPSRWWERWLRK